MMEHTPPPELSLALTCLRVGQGWSQKKLARALGIPRNLLSDYERGRKAVSRERLESAAAVLGLPPTLVDSTLDFIRSFRRSSSRAHGRADPEEWRIDFIAHEAGKMTQDFVSALFGRLSVETRAYQARQEAVESWSRLKRYDGPARRMIVEEALEYRNWALCELVCEESVKAAGDSADRAVELAELALLIAELAPGNEGWRSRLQGYAWAHVGNARRVKGDLPSADEAFARSQKLWEVGLTAESKFLNEARVLGLKASLRQAQRRLAESLELVNRALEADQGRETSYLLLNKAKLLEELGDFEAAIMALRQATPLIEAKNEPRLLFALRLNLAVNLCFLGLYAEAERLLLDVRKLVHALSNGLDGVRFHWLQGRIAAGLGKRQEAILVLSGVRQDFLDRGIAYDMALSSLELAVLYLEEGRTAEVRIIARQMAPIFKTQGVHREALAALKLFREAAEREVVTVDLTRRLVAYLQRAQYNPNLRFEE
jgi:transcriptional regulator with XRE-family HTH domain